MRNSRIRPIVLLGCIAVAVAIGVVASMFLTSSGNSDDDRDPERRLTVRSTRIPASISGATVTSAALGEDGSVALGTSSGAVHLFNPALRRVRGGWTAPGRVPKASSVAVSSDASTVAAVLGGALVVRKGESSEIHALRADRDATALALSAHGNSAAVAGFNVDVYDIAAERRLRRFEQPIGPGGIGQYQAVSFTSDGSTVVASKLGGVDEWNVRTGSRASPDWSCRCGADGSGMSGDGSLVTFGTSDAHVLLWDVSARRVLVDETVSSRRGDHVYGTDVTSNGRRLVAGTASGELTIWDLAKDQVLARKRFSGEPVVDIQIDKSGNVVLVEVQKPWREDTPALAADRWLLNLK